MSEYLCDDIGCARNANGRCLCGMKDAGRGESVVKVRAVNGKPVLLFCKDMVDLTLEQAEKLGWELLDAAHNYRLLLSQAPNIERKTA